jgi:hypothetical protein
MKDKQLLESYNTIDYFFRLEKQKTKRKIKQGQSLCFCL